MLKLDHLSKEDHEAAATLLHQVQRDLTELTRLVRRAPFTDRVMRCQKGVQEKLIDPMREVAGRQGFDAGPTSLYPNVYYAVGRVA